MAHALLPRPALRRRGAGLVLSVLIAATALVGAAGPASAADPTPAPSATDPGTTATWGTRPTDNTVGTARPNYGYDAQPGGTVRDSIDVVNRGAEPITLKVYASDAFTTESGGIDLLPAGGTSVDVGSWISMDEAQVTIPAGDTVTVPFTLSVPANATPGDHTGGIVTSLVTDGTGGQVSVDRRLGSRVYIRVAGDLAPALTVTDVSVVYDGTLNPAAGGTATVTYTVTNVGNARLKAHQAVRVSGPLGLLGAAATPGDLPELLPGNSVTRTEQVTGVPPTVRSNVEVALDPYDSVSDGSAPFATTSGTAATWSPPWGQLLVLLVVAALVVAAVLLRRRRRAAVQTAIDTAVAQALQGAAAGTDLPAAGAASPGTSAPETAANPDEPGTPEGPEAPLRPEEPRT